MNITFSKIAIASAIMAAAAFTTSAAQAEATVKVPFTFTVAGKVCPAGLYTIQQDRNHSMVTLTSKNAAKSFTWVLGPGDASSHVTLKFDAQGQDHILRAVQYDSLTTSNLNKPGRQNERVYSHVAQGQ